MVFTKLHARGQSKQPSEREKRIYSFLNQQRVAVLSSVTPNGDPHGTVIYYVIDEDLKIHFLTKTRTRKYDNLLHNNHVMLTIFDADTQTTAQILGVANEQSHIDTVSAVSKRLFERTVERKENQLPPILKLQAGAFTTFAISPVQIRWAVFGRPDPGEYEDLFESIESFELHAH